MRNRVVHEQTIRDREDFIKSIDPGVICSLASSYHDKRPCRIFKTATHGSFNVCLFVEFDPVPAGGGLERWVIRIPFPKRVPWVDEKIETEVATMMYVAENTTIPIPQVRAWSYATESPISLAFIIMDYVEGTTLDALEFCRSDMWGYRCGQRSRPLTRVYNQLADLYIQLRSLEFPRIGALGLPTKESPGIAVRHRPMPIEVILQETEGLDPTVFFPQNTTFTTSTEYIGALVKLANNQLSKSKDPDFDTRKRDARKVMFAYQQFSHYVNNYWIKGGCESNNGPFVLMHGDLSMHGNNLLWDQNLNLVAVLDWEWSYTVPQQCFVPPVWLTGFDPEPVFHLTYIGLPLYQIEMTYFCQEIARRADKYWPLSPLSKQWLALDKWPHYLIVMALLYPETIYDVWWHFLTYKLNGVNKRSVESMKRHNEKAAELVDRYFEVSKPAQDLLQRKLSEQKHFDKECDEYIDQNGGQPRDCQCQSCQKQREHFRVLRKLPSRSPLSNTMTTSDSFASLDDSGADNSGLEQSGSNESASATYGSPEPET